jgi:hypothetical protein
MHLPTRTFNNIRTAKCFAREIGERTIREKMEVGRQSQTDVFDMLCEFQPYSIFLRLVGGVMILHVVITEQPG